MSLSETALYGSNNIVISSYDVNLGYTSFGKTGPQQCVDINGNLQINGYIMDTNNMILRSSNVGNMVQIYNGFGNPSITVSNTNILNTAFCQYTDGRSNNIYVDANNVNGFSYISFGGYTSNTERVDFGSFASRFRIYRDMRGGSDNCGIDSLNNFAACNLLYFNGSGQIAMGTKGILSGQTVSINGSVYASNMNTVTLTCTSNNAQTMFCNNNLTVNSYIICTNGTPNNNTFFGCENGYTGVIGFTMNSTNSNGTVFLKHHAFQADSKAFKANNTSAWDIISDVRLKKDVVEIQDGLNVISKIIPVSYKWRENKAHGNNSNTLYGFTTQNISQILPHLVDECHINNDLEKPFVKNNTSYTLNTDLLPWIIASIKELNIKLENIMDKLNI